MTWGQVAAEMSVDRSTARRMAARCLRDAALPAATGMVEREAGILAEARDRLVWTMNNPGPKVSAGREIPGTTDGDVISRAADALRRNSESVRKLYGLDQPVRTQVELKTEDDVNNTLKAVMAQILYASMLAAEAKERAAPLELEPPSDDELEDDGPARP